jgi:hypothetical protein
MVYSLADSIIAKVSSQPRKINLVDASGLDRYIVQAFARPKLSRS